MFFHFTIYNTKHNPPENYKLYRRNQRFSVFMAFQNANENEFHGFGTLFGFGNVLEKFWKFF